MIKQLLNIGLMFKGMVIGIAEVIPGVSGGTIAFITGIYEKLINTIKAFSPALITVFKEDGFKGVWATINGNFLVSLLGGMLFGLVVGVFGVTHILEKYPQLLWAFFFGLIIASSIYIGKQVKWKDIGAVIAVLLGVAIAFYITIASPSQGNEALWFVFLSGVIAISALILPGISGSFILLLMGMYTFIIPTVKDALSTFSSESIIIVVVFGLGCLIGLATFSRVLSWTFKNHKNKTLAILTGFMIGSLNKLWPWRNVEEWVNKETGEIVTTNPNNDELFKILFEQSVLPASFEGEAMVAGAIVCMIVGFVLVFAMERFATSSDE